MEACSFLKLPAVLLVDILTEWIKAGDVGRFDSACCRKSDRQLLLALLQENELVFPTVHHKKYGRNMDARLKWIISRKVKCTEFLVGSGIHQAIAAECAIVSGNHLKTLEISNSSSSSISNLLKAVSLRCHGLESLKVSLENTNSVNEVIATNPRLRTLEISSAKGLALDLQSVRLTRLSLASCLLADTSFLRNCGTLTELDLTGCTLPSETSAMDIGIYCTQLQSLYVSDTSIDDDEILHIVTHCDALTALDVSSCYGITDTGIMHISLHGAHLKHLQIEYNDQLSNVSLGMLAFHSTASTLTTISVDSCSNFTAESLALLLEKCTKLTHLSTTIDENAEVYLAKCAQLHKLDLLNLYMEPIVCEAIATHCANLQILTLLYCKQIDAENLTVIARRCPKLRTIKVTTTNKAWEMASPVEGTANAHRDNVVVQRLGSNNSNIRCRW
eukprot:gene18494-21053_t